MNDRILEGYLKDFVDTNGLQQVDEPEAFEHFINYCIISREHPENFDYESVAVGGFGDQSIDGVAILVNEHLVASKEEIDFFKRNLRRLDVRFIFIQSKTSAKFELGEIGNFIFGVRSFFSKQPPDDANPRVRALRDLKEYVYDASIDMDRTPVCDMYYATTGKWQSNPALNERIQAETKILEQTNLFSRVSFTPLDAEALKSIYRELKRKVVREIIFEKHTILPRINNVQEAYIGLLPGNEYLKLVCDSEGKLQRSLFYDNVRDFQGHNPVNLEIVATLNDFAQRDKFVVLNNGITVVAQSITKVGSTFRLRDFQIVNGCQTSHVLYRNQPAAANVWVPVKIVVTGDADVTNLIIKGTNRQTEVKVEAFESLNPFQKEVEEFYATFGKMREPRLYYERRSKQYESQLIKPQQIISLAAQVKCFIAMFLNEPHSTANYYGELLERNRNRIFLPNHSPFPYYISAFALYTFDRLFEAGEFPGFDRGFRYQFLMLFRLLSEKSELPYLNDKKSMDGYCGHLLEMLASRESALQTFKQCASLLRETLNAGRYDSREASRLKDFTSDVMGRARTGKSAKPAGVAREHGTVKWFSDIKCYGFIQSEGRDNDIFVHFTAIRGSGYRSLQQGEPVEFSVIETDKGLQAVDVAHIDS